MYKNERPGGKRGKGKFTMNRKGTENFCLYCGSIADTRDHLPTQALLKEPYPKDLSVIPACNRCNNGFSNDEDYVSSFLFELKQKVENKFDDRINESKKHSCKIEMNIIKKIAIGHVGYVYDYLTFDSRIVLKYKFIFELSNIELLTYNDVFKYNEISPEIGSRAMFITINQENDESYVFSDWVVVQEGVYRYYTEVFDDFAIVKIVIYEILLCDVYFFEDK